MATPVSVEAEFHYRVVAKELERDQPPSDIKSHIYIFEHPEDWQQFQASGRTGAMDRWNSFAKAACSFSAILNNKFSDNILGHEIVHLVLHRFYADGIPCWLDEGFAQYISKIRPRQLSTRARLHFQAAFGSDRGARN